MRGEARPRPPLLSARRRASSRGPAEGPPSAGNKAPRRHSRGSPRPPEFTSLPHRGSAPGQGRAARLENGSKRALFPPAPRTLVFFYFLRSLPPGRNLRRLYQGCEEEEEEERGGEEARSTAAGFGAGSPAALPLRRPRSPGRA